MSTFFERNGVMVPADEIKRELGEAEPALVDVLQKMIRNPQTFAISATSWETYLTFSALQLSVTHAGLPERMRVDMEQAGRRLQHALTTAYPEITTLLEAGWHREFDEPEPAAEKGAGDG